MAVAQVGWPLPLPRAVLMALGLLLMAGPCPAAHPEHDAGPAEQRVCSDRFKPPMPVPIQGTDHNGVVMEEVCISTPGPEYEVYIVGDWGGLTFAEIPHMPPIPADKRSMLFPDYARDFVVGVDDRAQLLVAEQMRVLAMTHPPDYLLNVGDNFYWGGVEDTCGKPPFEVGGTQFESIFENVYWGTGLDGKPWLGVLGNHDYGGYHFVGGWDQAIGYSWGLQKYSTQRWLTVAQYWLQKVNYPTFSVEYYFVDTNAFEVWPPDVNGGHNICGLQHNPVNATCGAQGPHSLQDCAGWFAELWERQMPWMEEHLAKSTATWQVAVTHFPSAWGVNDWRCLAERYGLDVHVSGHLHLQRLVAANGEGNDLGATALVVSGGGGGITAEFMPSADGNDDAYGFVRMTLTATKITLTSISHSGAKRITIGVQPRARNYTRAQCAPQGLPDCHFENMGGEDQACRTDTADDSQDYIIFESVASMRSCQRHCRLTSLCTAVEFGYQRCKVFTRPVNRTVELHGYSCMRKVDGPAAPPAAAAPHKAAAAEGAARHGHKTTSAKAATQKAATVAQAGAAHQPTPRPHAAAASAASALPFRVGADYACRGGDAASGALTLELPGGAPTVTGCERACLSQANCTGVQYGPKTACELWYEPITSSAASPGTICLPREAGPADMFELAGQLHV